MAARIRRGTKDAPWAQVVRDRIQVSQLINRLEKNALSEKELMTTGQIRSAEILLKKVVPDLSQSDSYVEHSGSDLKDLMQEIDQANNRIVPIPE